MNDERPGQTAAALTRGSWRAHFWRRIRHRLAPAARGGARDLRRVPPGGPRDLSGGHVLPGRSVDGCRAQLLGMSGAHPSRLEAVAGMDCGALPEAVATGAADPERP